MILIAFPSGAASQEKSARAPAVKASAALERVPAGEAPSFQDDAEPETLLMAVDQSLRYYRALPPGRKFAFGPDIYTAPHMIRSLEEVRSVLLSAPDSLADTLLRNFIVYRAVNGEKQDEVLYSAYYEHSLAASLTPDGVYRYPLYRPPADLVKRTDPAHPDQTLWGRREGEKLVPYHSREEIDSRGVLKGKQLEIAWAKDPVDIFFLQVQGSGWLELPDGRQVRVRYAAHNGHPYVSVGGYMLEKGLIPRGTFSREAFVEYMKSRPEERQSLLNHNPRYVFFQLDTGPTSREVTGALRVGLTAGRSIASDHTLFPPGALAWMDTSGKVRVSRFVLNQDQGGAIKGPGRVDYFVGAGKDAEAYAVRVWQTGKLYFLVRKKGR